MASASFATRTSSPVSASRLRSRISYPSRAKRRSFFRRIRFVRVGGTLICGIFAFVILCDLVQGYAGEFILRQHGEEFPANFERPFDGAVFSETLVDKFTLEGAPELQVFLVHFA